MKTYMARVITDHEIKDLNELNEGYPIYFETRRHALDALKAFLLRNPFLEYGHVIKVEGGHYRTVDKIGY